MDEPEKLMDKFASIHRGDDGLGWAIEEIAGAVDRLQDEQAEMNRKVEAIRRHAETLDRVATELTLVVMGRPKQR